MTMKMCKLEKIAQRQRARSIRDVLFTSLVAGLMFVYVAGFTAATSPSPELLTQAEITAATK